VRALPEGFEISGLFASLADGWGFDVQVVEYAPVGAGSYHWVVTDSSGTRAFVTVDDLDQKKWLGDTRESAFAALRAAFDTAATLRDAGLPFVVAPIRTSSGATVLRTGARHAVALFPFVDGRSGRFGHADAAEQVAVASMLAELHKATPVARSVARSVGIELPGRGRLESSLQELGQAWVGGPLSEPARRALAANAGDMADLLALADRLSAAVESRGSAWVITHGEPHAGNVMRTAQNRVLVDWDTVALAPPERDLWMLVGDSADDAANVYTDATGHRLDDDAVSFFRLTWDLKDLAEYLNVLRSLHRETEDTARAYEGLTRCVSMREQWKALLEQ
jgi:spectinomycin phosphotransferase